MNTTKDTDLLVAAYLDTSSLASLCCTSKAWYRVISEESPVTRNCTICKKRVSANCKVTRCEEFLIPIEKTLKGILIPFSHSFLEVKEDDTVSEDDGKRGFWTEFLDAIYRNVVVESVESKGRTYFQIKYCEGDCEYGKEQPIDKYNFRVK